MISIKQNKLKIWFPLYFYYPEPVGGMEKFAGILAGELSERGYQTRIISAKKSAKQNEQRQMVTQPPFSVEKIYLPKFSPIPYYHYLFSLYLYLKKNYMNFDVLFASGMQSVSSAAIASAHSCMKKVILRVSSQTIQRHIKHIQESRVPFFAQWAIKRLRDADCYVVMSSSIKNNLLEWGIESKRIFCIPTGIDTSYWHPVEDKTAVRQKLGLSPESFLAIYVAMLRPEKDHSTLLKAWKKFSGTKPDAKLLLLGDGHEKMNIAAFIEKLGLKNSVILLGYSAEVLNYLQAADVFVFSSQTEGSSNAILEAMACALPVIASNIETNAEIITDNLNGLLFPAGDHDLLFSKINFISNNPALSKAFGEKARYDTEAIFSLKSCVDKYEEMINWVAFN